MFLSPPRPVFETISPVVPLARLAKFITAMMDMSPVMASDGDEKASISLVAATLAKWMAEFPLALVTNSGLSDEIVKSVFALPERSFHWPTLLVPASVVTPVSALSQRAAFG